MAEEKAGLGEFNFRQLFPWTELFRSFQIARDLKKLFLAAAGILVMAAGWWLLAWAFFDSQAQPDWKAYKDSTSYADEPADVQTTKRWRDFKEARRQWSILYSAAGNKPVEPDGYDFAKTPDDVTKYEQKIADARKLGRTKIDVDGVEQSIVAPPYGWLRTLPFFEDRGPNPYLLVTGQVAPTSNESVFGDWVRKQAYVLVEPLFKFFYPLYYLLSPRTGLLNRFYFLLVTLVTLATWALFGGAITRMAVVEVARNDKVSIGESLRFVAARYLSYFSAPIFPLLLVAFLVFLVAVPFGLLYLIPVVGDIVISGIGWVLVLGAALAMAVVLVGLVGWPMMNATISAEGSDSFDAISRSYSYVYQAPWSYIGYCLVSIAYGAVVVFFVGFMGSLVVYLGKWSISQTPFVETANREPSFLFIYAPTSFGWRTLLLDGATTADGESVVKEGRIDENAYRRFVDGITTASGTREGSGLNWWNHTGAFMVAGWLYLAFLLVLGFGYSYFWTASTLIYLLMRRKVDDTDLDEIYLEEDEAEEPYTAPATVSSTTAPAPPTTTPLTMVNPPTLRPSTPPVSTPPAAPAAEPSVGSGPSGEANGPADGDKR
jgi:hypothetical protein